MAPLAVILAAACLLAAGCGGGDGLDLKVSAAASLKAALTDYARGFDPATARFSFAGSDVLAAQIRAGARPDQRHNNCSGKHTAMLAVCRHLGEATRGYIAIDHPHQKRVVATFEAMLGIGLARAPRGIDGCSLPQFGMPVAALARAYAKFAAPDALPSARAVACRALADAMRAEPFMVSGSRRFCTRAIEACGGKAVVKTGAEGCYIAAIPARGIGIALKIDDGASRAAEAAMAHLLLRHAVLDDAAAARVRALIAPLLNAAGRPVGALAAAPGF